MTQPRGSVPATPIRNLANRNLAIRNLVVSTGAATILLTVATGASGSPDALYRTYSATVYSTAAGPAVPENDAATADVDPRTGLAQYSEVAQNSGGALGDYLKTIENMEPALKAVAGDFARPIAALESAHTAMVAAALRKDDEPDVEEQGRGAIRGANEAINAQGKADEYTANLERTGAFERQWGRKRAPAAGSRVW
jgi:hypothetical protein